MAAIVAVSVGCGSGAAATQTYTATRTAACLIAAGKRVERGKDVEMSYSYPEIREQIFWKFGKHTDIGVGISIMFTRDATAASHLVTRLRRLAYSFGATKARRRRQHATSGVARLDEAAHANVQRGNAVWSDSSAVPTAKQVAVLTRCIR
jgi:hypothetical protein